MNYYSIFFYILIIFITGCTSKAKQVELSALDFYDDKEMISFLESLKDGNLELVNSYIQQGIDINLEGKKSMCPIGWCVAVNNYESFKFLIEKGANTDIYFHSDYFDADISLLLGCSLNKNPEYLKLILEKGTDPNSSSRKDNTEE